MTSNLTKRPFMLLLAGRGVSRLGDWALVAALPVALLQSTGSQSWAPAAVLAATAPAALLPIAGALVDRFPRLLTIFFGNAVCALVYTALIPFVKSPILPYAAVTTVFLGASISQLVSLSIVAQVPEMVPGEYFGNANALLSVADRITRIVGPSVGVYIFASRGLGLVLWFDILTYVAAAALFLPIMPLFPIASHRRQISSPGTVKTPGQRFGRGASRPSLLSDIRDCLNIVKDDQVLRVLVVASIGGGFSLGIIGSSLAPFAEVRFLSASSSGYLASAQSIGSLIGALLAPTALAYTSIVTSVGLPMALAGTLLVIACTVNNIRLGMLVFGFSGIPSMISTTAAQTLMQMNCPKEVLGRFAGALGTIYGMSALLGSLLSVAALWVSSALWLMLVAAAVLISTGLWVWRGLTITQAAAAPAN